MATQYNAELADLQRLSGVTVVKEGANTVALGRIAQQFDEIEDALQIAIRAAKEARNMCMQVEIREPVEGQLEYYLIRHLQAWIEDENQPGSLASLRRMLDRARQPDEE